MRSKSFGEMLRELRLNKRLTLRRFCQMTGLDPGNVSRWERNVTAPPQIDDTLNRMAAALGLEEGSDAYEDFFALAAISGGRLPKRVISDGELVAKLPMFFRTLDGRKLTEEQLGALIEKIKEEL